MLNLLNDSPFVDNEQLMNMGTPEDIVVMLPPELQRSTTLRQSAPWASYATGQ
jgi:hypothetical protein